MQASIEELRAFVEKNRHEMLLFWENLVNMQAGSHEIEKVNSRLQRGIFGLYSAGSKRGAGFGL